MGDVIRSQTCAMMFSALAEKIEKVFSGYLGATILELRVIPPESIEDMARRLGIDPATLDANIVEIGRRMIDEGGFGVTLVTSGGELNFEVVGSINGEEPRSSDLERLRGGKVIGMEIGRNWHTNMLGADLYYRFYLDSGSIETEEWDGFDVENRMFIGKEMHPDFQGYGVVGQEGERIDDLIRRGFDKAREADDGNRVIRIGTTNA